MDLKIEAIVEIPRGSMYKYEMDKSTGLLVVDRPLPVELPYNYGYIPDTLHGDGDPLDICIVGAHPIYPLTKVKVSIIGAFLCNDNGMSDDKLVGIVVGESYFDEEIAKYLDEVRHYLSTYKKGFCVGGLADVEEARSILQKDLVRYEQDSGN
jgi:inorganic pyrophosphatase